MTSRAPGATLEIVCDLARVSGPQPNGSFAVTLPQERAPTWNVVLAQTGEQAAFELEDGRVAHRQMHLAPLEPARRTMLAGKPLAVGAKADTGTVRCPAGRSAAMSREINRFDGWSEHRYGICTLSRA